MKPFIFEKWHVWEATKGLLVSDEETKQLFAFDDIDKAITWFFINDLKPVARALYQHKKEGMQ